MRKFDKDGLILCEMQGQVFEMSIETTSTSSEIFYKKVYAKYNCKKFRQWRYFAD